MIKTVTLSVETHQKSEFINITPDIVGILKKHPLNNGHVTLFVPHTTAGVTINENADPDVQGDMIRSLDALAPNLNTFKHFEGNSDAHIKSSLIGASEHVLVEEGRLLLGTWQGLYFAEFDGPRKRKLHVHIHGE